MKKILSLLILVIVTSSSCEKDDICDANTPTTPRLVIDFYDRTNPTVKKNVTNLKVIGDGKTEGIVFNSGSETTKYLYNGTTISIPLKADANTTKYRFILNFGNANPTLTDTDEVIFNYSRTEVYVSRACGFKTLFTFVPLDPYIQTAVPITKEKWMQAISIVKTNIDYENETHVKIYF